MWLDSGGAEGTRLSLRGADLIGVDLSEALLGRAILKETNLSNAYLVKANLREADLSGSILRDADLRDADLVKANFYMANLSGAILRLAGLIGADLRRAYLIEADLSNAILDGAKLEGAHLDGANLSKTELSKAKLIKADLSNANLRGANLFDADLSGANLSGANLTETNFVKACLVGADLSLANLSGADITDANKSRWIIDGVTCTHIIDKGKRIDFDKEDGFVHLYTQIEEVVDIILEIPSFSVSTSSYIAEAIASAVNKKTGEPVVRAKGVEALTDNKVRLSYNMFGNDNKELQEFIAGAVQDGMKDYFKNNPLEDASRDPLDGALAISYNIPGTPFGIEHSQLLKMLNRFIVARGKLGNDIFQIINNLSFNK